MTRLAAIPYASDFGIDAFMQGIVGQLRRRGLRLGGVIQHNDAECDDRCMAMSLEDLTTGTRFPISQDLGPSAEGCRLDAAGLAAAAAAFSSALGGQVDLVVVNKFGKQEALGEGLRDEIARAVMAGLPVLLAVRHDFLPAWRAFAGDDWIELAADAGSIERWARDATRLAA
jgi:nucleoside-triphosphatase THEP1